MPNAKSSHSCPEEALSKPLLSASKKQTRAHFRMSKVLVAGTKQQEFSKLPTSAFYFPNNKETRTATFF